MLLSLDVVKQLLNAENGVLGVLVAHQQEPYLAQIQHVIHILLHKQGVLLAAETGKAAPAVKAQEHKLEVA